MIRRISALACCGALLLAAPAWAERKALLIGNSGYEREALGGKPHNDARMIREALERVGFGAGEITLRLDLDKEAMEAAARDFGRSLGPADEAVLYYSGHGVQYNGHNYLLPIGALRQISAPGHLKEKAVSLDYLLSAIEGSRVNVVIVDACRDSPFKGLFKGEAPSGLTMQSGGDGTLVAYATEEGAKALAGAGSHSPYAEALAQELPLLARPGVDIHRVFAEVRRLVMASTNGMQKPKFVSGLNGAYCLAGCTVAEDPEKARLERENERLRAELALRGEPSSAKVAPMSLAAVLAESVVSSFQADVSGPEMISFPGRHCFTIGSPEWEKDRRSDENQKENVCVGDFALATKEVTKGEFGRFVATTGYRTVAERGEGCRSLVSRSWDEMKKYSWRSPGFPQGDDHPVVCVSRDDAAAYVKWLAKETGKGYRLPTEAEWEYGARGADKNPRYFSFPRFWGEDPAGACNYVNVADRDTAKKLGWGGGVHVCNDGQIYTAPVGSYRANPTGLYDMLGNVWEWSCSEYEEKYKGQESRCSSRTDAEGGVLRGGGWDSKPENARVAARDHYGRAFNNVGFRLARTL